MPARNTVSIFLFLLVCLTTGFFRTTHAQETGGPIAQTALSRAAQLVRHVARTDVGFSTRADRPVQATARQDSIYGTIEGEIAGLPADGVFDVLIVAMSTTDQSGTQLEWYGKPEPDGTYRIDLPAGDYFVSVVARGYEKKYYNDVTDPALASVVSVSAGGKANGIDFRMEPETPGTGALSGTVLSEGDGSVIAGARVFVFSIDNPMDMGQAVTDDRGRYRVETLKTGRYYVQVDAAGFIPELYDNVVDYAGAVPVTITEPNETAGIDFELARGGTIRGVVTNRDGNPSAGVFVEAFTAVPWDSTLWEGGGVYYQKQWAISDENGAYELSGLTTGDYYVFAQLATGWFYETLWYPGTHRYDEAATVHVQAGSDVDGIDFTFDMAEAGGTIRGRVTDRTGNPLKEVWINVESTGDKEPNDPVTPYIRAYAVTDENGAYEINLLPEGEYYLSAVTYNEYQYLQVWYPNAATREEAQVIRLDGQGVVDDIDFELHLRTASSEISGFVRDDQGQALPGAYVEVTPADPYVDGIWKSTTADENGSYRIDRLPEGSYFVRASYWQDESYGQQWYDGVATAEEATTISLGEGDVRDGIDFRVAVRPIYGDIEGIVTDTTTGLPIDRAYVELVPTWSSWEYAGFRFWGWHTITGPDGRYHLDGIPEGQYTMAVYANGAFEYFENAPVASRARSVEVVGGRTTTVPFDLTVRNDGNGMIAGKVEIEAFSLPVDSSAWEGPGRGGIVSSGRVFRAEGTTSVPDVAVVIARPADQVGIDDGSFYTAVTAPDGTYQLKGLPDGEFVLMSFAPGYVGEYYPNVYDPASAEVVKIAGGAAVDDVDFALSAAYWYALDDAEGNKAVASVYGRVTNSDGQNLEGATVYLVAENGQAIGFSQTDPEGRYELSVALPGRYRVQVTRPGYAGNYNGYAPTFEEADPIELIGGRTELNVVLNPATSTGTDDPSDLPDTVELIGNYPNPFNPATVISFKLGSNGPVRLSVYNVLGARVAVLVDRPMAAGAHEVRWNGLDSAGRPAPSGLYLYRIETERVVRNGSMTLVK